MRPIISNLSIYAYPANQPFNITCDVTNFLRRVVDSVYLNYYTDFNLANLDSVLMSSTGGNSYSVGLPGQSNGTSLIYWVKAWGNGISYYF